MRKKFFLLFLVFIVSIAGTVFCGEVEDIAETITGGSIFEITKQIASDDMQGRFPGHEGYEKVSNWAASKFKEWGLEPVYKDYFQRFNVFFNEVRSSSFSITLPPQGKNKTPEALSMEIYKDYCPLLSSGFGEVKGEVVFIGHGITAPELAWDDYRDVDVKGKIVAILRGAPKIEGKDFSPYNTRHNRILNAHRHGAAGVILIYISVVTPNGPYVKGLPVIMIGKEVATEFLESKGYDFDTVKALLRDGHQLSFNTGVKVKIEIKGIHHPKAETYNVAGMLRGSDPKLAGEYVIFGAHLDHIGPWPQLHPGANDNASGSAIVMTLARAFSQLQERPKRTMVFVLFSAEEMGLLGSKYMASHLPDFPSKPLLMINYDMNGVGNGLYISGAKTYPGFYNFVEQTNQRYKINGKIKPGEISPRGGGSDYAPFLAKGIPAYANWVTGGKHKNYHTPWDTIYHITPKIMEDIARLYFLAGYQFANK